jgi:hypothetical protein
MRSCLLISFIVSALYAPSLAPEQTKIIASVDAGQKQDEQLLETLVNSNKWVLRTSGKTAHSRRVTWNRSIRPTAALATYRLLHRT